MQRLAILKNTGTIYQPMNIQFSFYSVKKILQKSRTCKCCNCVKAKFKIFFVQYPVMCRSKIRTICNDKIIQLCIAGYYLTVDGISLKRKTENVFFWDLFNKLRSGNRPFYAFQYILLCNMSYAFFSLYMRFLQLCDVGLDKPPCLCFHECLHVFRNKLK